MRLVVRRAHGKVRYIEKYGRESSYSNPTGSGPFVFLSLSLKMQRQEDKE